MSAAVFDERDFLATLTHHPGVYRMLDDAGEVLYVGKARDLRKRVSTYFGSKAHHPKTQALMNRTARVEVTVTSSEQEALLLEYNLIKQHRPRFNVLLRDDKSYPLIRVTTGETWPRFAFHRGSRKGPDQFFGPFPNAGAVRQTLGQLQKLFRVRQCEDSFFRNRSRPCLQYQIDRCTAPCVGLISEDDYRRDVRHAMQFLQGRNDTVLKELVERMEVAASAHNYEQAARYRDQISAIKLVQSRQSVSGARMPDTDVLAAAQEEGMLCIVMLIVRGGRVLGSRAYFPVAVSGTSEAEALEAFIVQHYFAQPPPAEILINAVIEDRELLEEALRESSGHRVRIKRQVRETRRRWQEMALNNARQALGMRRAGNANVRAQREALATALKLDETPERIECFDISHTAGESAMAACVVFGPEGPMKSNYRRFNIRSATEGDDYAAIAEAVRRRYTRVKKGEAPLPDLILIDGGRGQVGAARAVLEELQLDDIALFGVAKGVGRKAGRERLFRPGRTDALSLGADSPALHLVQQVRDEAHRFAITGHRQRRGNARRTSTLESIPGLGPARRRALLKHFGGLQGVRRAGIEDLSKVEGISRMLAERIYESLRG